MACHEAAPAGEILVQPGDGVPVLTGPFAGIEGVAVLRRGRGRLLVSLSTVAEGLAVDLDGGSLQVIAAAGRRCSAPAAARSPGSAPNATFRSCLPRV